YILIDLTGKLLIVFIQSGINLIDLCQQKFVETCAVWNRRTNLATPVVAIRVPVGHSNRYIHAAPDWSATKDIFYFHRINFRLDVILRIPKLEMSERERFLLSAHILISERLSTHQDEKITI
ncbi:hypothetical protein C5O24_05040, partial [Paramuribaculum intestinale]